MQKLHAYQYPLNRGLRQNRIVRIGCNPVSYRFRSGSFDSRMKQFFRFLAVLVFPAAATYGQNIIEAYNTTILAGRSQAVMVLDGIGEEARFQSITAMWGDSAYLYVADGMTVRRIELATARVTTLSQTAATGIHRQNSNSGFSYNFF
jgi:hypothetical protein